MRQESDDTQWREHLRGRGYEVPEGMALYVPDGDGIAAPARYRAEDSDTAFLTDRFLERMETETVGWFAALTFIRPHPPLVAPAPYNTMYGPADLPPPALGTENAPHPFIEALRRTKPVSDMVKGFPDLPETPEVTGQLRAL